MTTTVTTTAAHLAGIARERMRRHLAPFMRAAWEIVDPTPLIWGWHLDAIAAHLEAAIEGRLPNNRLAINIAPGLAKSLTVSVLWPVWVWLRRPTWRALTGSYDAGLAIRDCMRSRYILESDWYRDTFDPQWDLREDQNVKSWYANTSNGMRMAISAAPGARVTGFRGDAIIVDDPHKVDDHPDARALEQVAEWWFGKMSTRINDREQGLRVIVHQRVHEDDLTGRALAQAKRAPYVHLCLPTEFDPERRCTTPIGWTDPRTQPGDLICPEVMSREAVELDREDLGSYGFAAQHQQQPVSESGGIIKPWWVRYWLDPTLPEPRPVTVRLPSGEIFECPQEPLPPLASFEQVWSSWDFAFKGTASSSLVAGEVWARLGGRFFWLDTTAANLTFTESKRALRLTATAWPTATAHLVEDAANGPAILSELSREIAGLIPIPVKGGKPSRGHAVAPLWEAGSVWMPHPEHRPWATEARTEILTFPASKKNDRFDAHSQALSWPGARRTAPRESFGFA